MSTMDIHPISIRIAGGDSYSPFCLDEEKIVRIVREPELADRDDVLHAIRCERCSQLVHETREKFAALQEDACDCHRGRSWTRRAARAAVLILAIGVGTFGTLGVKQAATTYAVWKRDSAALSFTAWTPVADGVELVGRRNGLLEVCLPVDELSSIDKVFLDRTLEGIGNESVMIMAKDGTAATVRRGSTSAGGSIARHAQDEYGDLSMQIALLAFNDLCQADPGNLPDNTPMWFPQRDLLQAWASMHPTEIRRAELAFRRAMNRPMM